MIEGPLSNKISLFLIAFSKITGIMAVGLGFLQSYRTIGAVLLVFAVLSLIVSISLAIFQMKKENEPVEDPLEKLIKEGKLEEKLLELGLKLEKPIEP